MTTAGQALTSRPSRLSAPGIALVLAASVGIGAGFAAGRIASTTSAPAGPTVVAAPAAQQAPDDNGLVAYLATSADLRAALARNDMVAAAHFRARLATLKTPVVVAALAHRPVDLELGLAAATTRHDQRMAAEFRTRLANETR